ncbi:MAG TPA: PIG-L family deacetylase, partial [Vicinamibacteria bacterium]
MGAASRRAALPAIGLLAFLFAVPAAPQRGLESLDRGATGLGLALRRLPVAVRVLHVTAHPDDEPDGVQARLSRGLGFRTGLLTLTRGAGGQNQIGPELGEALSVLRTAELQALHRYDGVEQLFGRAVDFGFSFSIEETLDRWGHEASLGDVVRVYRRFRPDVVLTLPLEGTAGLHHQGASHLALEAFRAAADPARFPEQLTAGLWPWQPRKIYQGGVGGGGASLRGDEVVIPTAEFDPLVGLSWQQLGSLARSMHRCQGMSQLLAAPLTGEGHYWLIDSEPAVKAREKDVTDGIDVSLRHILDLVPAADPGRVVLESGLPSLSEDVENAQRAFDPRALDHVAAPLSEALARLRQVRAGFRERSTSDAARFEVTDRLDQKEREIEAALTLAHALDFEAVADRRLVVPGESFEVTASVYDQGALGVAVQDVSVRVPQGWSVERLSGETGSLRPAESRAFRFRVGVAPDARPTAPYWHRRPGADRYDVDDPAMEGLPFAPREARLELRYATLGGVVARVETPAVVREEGRWVGGERREAVTVVPDLSVGVSPEVAVVPTASARRPREVRVSVVRHSVAAEASPVRVHLEVPDGWKSAPPDSTLAFAFPGQELVARFEVEAPEGLAEGETTLTAVAAAAGREYREGHQVVAYDHVEERRLYRPATLRLVAVDVDVDAGARVGYVVGTGDEVDEAIRALGVPVTLLDDGDLEAADLSRFTTIVLGVRSFEARRALRAASSRLLRYAEEGGHVVVQYQRRGFNEEGRDSPYAPYPGLAVTSSRVSDETAP